MRKISPIGLVSLSSKILFVLLAIAFLIFNTRKNGFETIIVIRTLITISISSIGIFLIVGLRHERLAILFKKKWISYLIALYGLFCAVILFMLARY